MASLHDRQLPPNLMQLGHDGKSSSIVAQGISDKLRWHGGRAKWVAAATCHNQPTAMAPGELTNFPTGQGQRCKRLSSMDERRADFVVP
jgi:hypothetical protein